MDAYALGGLFGGLGATFLISRLLLWLMRSWSGGKQRLFVVHGASLLLAAFVYGMGHADGGAFEPLNGIVIYAVPQLIWLVVDLARSSGGARPPTAVPQAPKGELDAEKPALTLPLLGVAGLGVIAIVAWVVLANRADDAENPFAGIDISPVPESPLASCDPDNPFSDIPWDGGASAGESIYTMYRSSPTALALGLPSEQQQQAIARLEATRVHVATFDVENAGADYNQQNCLAAQELYQSQPGVSVRYWCEAGRYRPN